MFFYPAITKFYSISVIIPVYNEQETIEDSIKSIYGVDYPNILEVVVVNDGSTDRTPLILKGLEKKYKTLKVINKPNSGKADSLNRALKLARGEFIAVIDADSYPEKNSFRRMIGFFDDAGVGAVTAACIPRNSKNFLEKLQVIEYKVIMFTRKLLEFVDSIYVTPGSLSIYRKKALEDVGGFDTKNLTEDIEATWHLLKKNWKIKMSFSAQATTTTPSKVGPWYIQRRRWAIGGFQCIQKYKNSFMSENMLGFFVIPFFTIGLFLSFIGILVFLYVAGRRVISTYLSTTYSIEVGAPLLTVDKLFITPSVLNYFGIILFVLFAVFTIFVLSVMKDNFLEKQRFFNFIFYLTIYLLIYPIVLVDALWHLAIGKKKWG